MTRVIRLQEIDCRHKKHLQLSLPRLLLSGGVPSVWSPEVAGHHHPDGEDQEGGDDEDRG